MSNGEMGWLHRELLSRDSSCTVPFSEPSKWDEWMDVASGPARARAIKQATNVFSNICCYIGLPGPVRPSLFPFTNEKVRAYVKYPSQG